MIVSWRRSAAMSTPAEERAIGRTMPDVLSGPRLDGYFEPQILAPLDGQWR